MFYPAAPDISPSQTCAAPFLKKQTEVELDESLTYLFDFTTS